MNSSGVVWLQPVKSDVELEISRLVEQGVPKHSPKIGSDIERFRSSLERLTSSSIDGLEGGYSEKLARILSPNATAFLPVRVVSKYASAHLDLIPGWPQRLSSCPDDAPRDGENILRLACGLVEQLIEFARRELAAPAIRNANSASGCFELAGFGDRDHRIDSVRLAASTVF